MANARNIVCCVVLGLCLILVSGCGKGADEDKSLGEVRAEAGKMNVQELRVTAMKYKEAIEAKRNEMEKVTAKLQDIPATERLGNEAKQIQTEIGQISSSISALTQRFEIYYQQLKEKGGDLSGLVK